MGISTMASENMEPYEGFRTCPEELFLRLGSPQQRNLNVVWAATPATPAGIETRPLDAKSPRPGYNSWDGQADARAGILASASGHPSGIFPPAPLAPLQTKSLPQ